jgi:hypothetical protein
MDLLTVAEHNGRDRQATFILLSSSDFARLSLVQTRTAFASFKSRFLHFSTCLGYTVDHNYNTRLRRVTRK